MVTTNRSVLVWPPAFWSLKPRLHTTYNITSRHPVPTGPFQGPLSPLNPRMKELSLSRAGLSLPCPLTTWARARHKVCSITQVFSKAERAAMVPLPCLSLLGSPNPLFSLLFPLPYSSPGRHSVELVEQSCPRGRRGGRGVDVGGYVHCPEKIHSGGRRELRVERGRWRGGGGEGSGQRETCNPASQAAPESRRKIHYAPINTVDNTHTHTHSHTHTYIHTHIHTRTYI